MRGSAGARERGSEETHSLSRPYAGSPASRPASQPLSQPKMEADSSPSGYTLLISTFKTLEHAESLAESLEALELDEEVEITQVTFRSEPWYRVTIGNFRERKEAEAFGRQLQEASEGIEPVVISETGEADKMKSVK